MPPAPLPQERDNPPSLLVFALCTGFRAARHRPGGPSISPSLIGVVGIEAVAREHDRFTRLHTEANPVDHRGSASAHPKGMVRSARPSS